ncbi:cellulose synthase (UDP-forming) [Octadecabacter temperatus]|uniref:Cellulose synthase 1 n=1 Tax=Octadecabacter temperatus TaxID=1458307 RepID=A0A0K0Y7J3_9RHOB|nr:glycosyltransferase [Octadecabacter temperatus]AKS46938.1 Cellulose synthase 1 [Octadecabacter temperatus]SIO23960.1 cellulose synthase (UDP-forming) [Octadecabacter temperatus]
MRFLPKPSANQSQFREAVLTGRTRVKYRVFVTVWLVAAGFFWAWWLRPEHNIGLARYVLVSACLFWVFFLQIYFIAMFMRAQQVAKSAKDLVAPRVAMVVTKAPAEPFYVVRETLLAMLAQDVKHDTWLADEDPQPETIAWCEANRIKISTRKGVDEYHQPNWPRRTRCKEGNLAYFYDHYGYEGYDFVAQLDADHVPQPGYLCEILRPFSDPSIGYVSAPSICSQNANISWAARTRLHAEAMFHGVLQAGYSNGWAPMCIGSHYAVRTQALREIGGLGPELAEDHSTSMLMNAGGWRGMHAMDAIAIGQGPANLADLVTQEFQWSRSLVTLLLAHTPRYFRALPARQKFQFVFSQLWYPIFAVFMAVMFALPIVALLFDVRFVGVTYPAFIAHVLPSIAVLVWLAYLIRADGFFRPFDAKVLGWEKALFAALQWPWVLWGCLMATWDKLSGKFVDFRVTPKGEAASSVVSWSVLLPYFALALGSLVPVLLATNVQDAAGFYIFALINAVIYTSLFAIIIVNHLRENPSRQYQLSKHALAQFAAVAVLGGAIGYGLVMQGRDAAIALATTSGDLQFLQSGYVVAGAGQGNYGNLHVSYNSNWFSDLLQTRNRGGE